MKRFAVAIFSLIAICTISFAGGPGNTTNQSFKKAKKILLKQVYYDQGLKRC